MFSFGFSVEEGRRVDTACINGANSVSAVSFKFPGNVHLSDNILLVYMTKDRFSSPSIMTRRQT